MNLKILIYYKLLYQSYLTTENLLFYLSSRSQTNIGTISYSSTKKIHLSSIWERWVRLYQNIISVLSRVDDLLLYQNIISALFGDDELLLYQILSQFYLGMMVAPLSKYYLSSIWVWWVVPLSKYYLSSIWEWWVAPLSKYYLSSIWVWWVVEQQISPHKTQ